MKKFLVPLLCLSSGTVLASESNCNYKTNVNTDFQGTISSSKNYNQKSHPYVDDTRICIVEMDVRINKAWYPTSGTYVFGPDMTYKKGIRQNNYQLKTMYAVCMTTVQKVPK